jgi:hypothetical protein
MKNMDKIIEEILTNEELEFLNKYIEYKKEVKE